MKKRVAELVAKMTLEEKIGQMTQITIQAVSAKQGNKDQHHELDVAKLQEAIRQYHVGSILNVYDKAHELDYWHKVITQIQDIATKETRLGIPVLYGIDAIHGATYTKGATLFPQALAVGSTWNVDIAKMIGEVTSLETRASGIPWNFYPNMDIGRQPLWSRLWESYGEDVVLSSHLGSAYIHGAQEEKPGQRSKLTTCLKHYVGYSVPFNGLDRTPAHISERMLREYHLPPFEAGVKAGSHTVMVNSAEIDGIPGHANYHLLTEVLRNEFQFEGLVVSDWEDIKRLHTRDKVAETPKEAVRLAVMAGVDMSMVPYDYSFYNLLIELVREGAVPESRINEAVSRILLVKMRVGLFENAYPETELKPLFASEGNTKLNISAAEESFVLLKNDDQILPLDTKKKIFVTGPTANMLSVLNGGWTITWQGNEEALYPQEKHTIYEALKARGGENVTYLDGCSFDTELNSNAAVSAAQAADVILLCLGEPAYCETPGNIGDLNLPQAQLDYARKMMATGKPVVLLLLQGRPRLITGIAEKAKSIVTGFLPGMEGGVAFANLVYGEQNFSGKLPVTYPNSPNGIVLYDHKPIESFDGNSYSPLYPFGFGLSYTTFQYSDLKVSAPALPVGSDLTVSVSVKNTGSRAGKEVVQLYLTDEYGSVSRPVKQLKGFTKIALQPGEVKEVSFTLKKDDFSFIGIENTRIVEPGTFKISVGGLSADFRLQ